MASPKALNVVKKQPCHNCRRRRVRCDRSWPGCYKCAVAGQDCLGYGKLIIWTEKDALLKRRTNRKVGEAASSNTTTLMKRDITTASNIFGESQLLDPISRELSWSCRYYIDYCEKTALKVLHNDSKNPALVLNRVCKDLVAYDLPETNPFRELVPLAIQHPFLLEILIAKSAIHWLNITRPKIKTWLPSLFTQGLPLAVFQPNDRSSRQALVDAVTAKQKAIGYWRKALDRLDLCGPDAVLAAMLFFVNVELIDVGKGGWRAHLEGATRIMALLKWTTGNDTCTSNSDLRDRIVADCLM
jgi:hypothetical protein